jgi:hypothetical protein
MTKVRSYPACLSVFALAGLMDLESRRVELRKQYSPLMSQALTVKDAARWLQIESQMEKLIDLQILSSLPIVE